MISNKTLEHAQTLYDALKSHATHKQVPGTDFTALVFTGSITKVFRECGISMGSYKKVTEMLADLGCIQLAQRGTRDYPSVIVLRQRPELPPPNSPAANNPPLTNKSRGDKMELRLRNVETNIGGIDVKTALLELDRRIKSLEAKPGKKPKTP